MADVFVSYARADREIVRPIVTLLEAQGWSVWWDTRIGGGDRWDAAEHAFQLERQGPNLAFARVKPRKPTRAPR